MSRVAGGGRIKTFSIGFPPEYADFDERQFARQVAASIGTEHEELEVEPNIGEAIHELGKIFDEPMGDSGAVPNLFVCRLARQHLTVALSGLGGDELCGGYQRYLGVLVAEWYRSIPPFLRQDVVRRLVDLIPESRAGSAGSTTPSGSCARASSPRSSGSSPSRARSSGRGARRSTGRSCASGWCSTRRSIACARWAPSRPRPTCSTGSSASTSRPTWSTIC